MIRYQSAKYGYSFSYPQELTLAELSPEFVELSAWELSAARGGGLYAKKTLSFALADLSDDADALKAYALGLAPDAAWQAGGLGGLRGYRAESRDGGRRRLSYALAFSPVKVLVIRLDEGEPRTDADALALALASFSADETSPQIAEVEFVPAAIPAGGSTTVRFRLHDAQVGVDQASIGREASGACAYLLNVETSRAGPRVCAPAAKTGPDTYELAFAANPFLATGDYIFGAFEVVDYAGNATRAYAGEDNDTYDLYGKGPGIDQNCLPLDHIATREEVEKCSTQIAAPALHVDNAGAADTEPPQFSRAEIAPAAVTAGGDFTFSFDLRDAGAGIDEASLTKAIAPWVMLVHEIDRQGDVSIWHGLEPLALPVAEGGDRYSVKIHVPAHFAAADYRLFGAQAADLAGNIANAPADLKIKILSDGVEDLTPPVVIALRVEPQQIHPGEMGTLYVQAKDDLTGVTLASYVGQSSMIAFNPIDDIAKGVRLDFVSSPIAIDLNTFTKLADDWFAVSFVVNPCTRLGKYVLPEVRVSDGASNFAGLKMDGSGGGYYRRYGGAESSVPYLYLSVVP